ncbi:site-specific integrase [uncultured Pseudoalteromonas sp.]|uniref:site-specific integrase n=1 Tax=uncultured Pseudoalteromonas sp. TaxID=114053 RepID=UPI002596EEF4|nr:site-specific integrase [uncultured Pseudoalteromonas sp.]
MYKLETLVFDNGERYPVLLDKDEMPHFYATLYVTTKLRSSMAVNTISNRLKAILWLYQWEKKKKRCLSSEFERGRFLTHEDIIDLREHLKVNAKELKKLEQSKLRNASRILNIEHSSKAITTVATVSRNHHYNRMTSVAEYLHFLATLLNQYRTCQSTASAIDDMSKNIKKARPKGINQNLGFNSDIMSLPDGLFDEFMEIACPEHPLNPFKNMTVKKRNYLLFKLIRETGIRRGELLSLEMTHLNLLGDKPSIWVKRNHDDIFDPRKKQPVSKTKERMLPISLETAKLLDSYILEDRAATPNAKKHPYIFVTHRKCLTQGQPISTSYFDNEIIPKMKKVDERFSKIHAHLFRHQWNNDFSRKVDKINKIRAKEASEGKSSQPLIEPAQEAKMRKHLMGHSSEKSGDIYNMRHIRDEANKVMLEEQKQLEKLIKLQLDKDIK